MDAFSKIIGQTFDSVLSDGDGISFEREGEPVFVLKHVQECCESVDIEEIHGDLEDLAGSPILLAEESYETDENASESGTWSFYKFATAKGHVTIRFYGSSNGYYSETASLLEKGDYHFNR